jgi:hypothetical protein
MARLQLPCGLKPWGTHQDGIAIVLLLRCREFCVPLEHSKTVIFNRELPRAPTKRCQVAQLRSCAAASARHREE